MPKRDRAHRTINGSRPALIESGGKNASRLVQGSGAVQRDAISSENWSEESRQVICCWRPLLGLPKRGKNAKIRAASEFKRRIPAMFIFSIRTVVLAVAVSASSLSSAATLSEQSELLCSPEGLMRLIPQFDVNGQFAIPDHNTELQKFLSEQKCLSIVIDIIIT